MINSNVLAVFLWVAVIAVTHRATRFLVLDVFPPIKAFRKAVYRRFGQQHPVSYLVGCFWCVSIWVALVVTLSAFLLTAGRLPYPWGLAALASSVSGMLGNRDYDDSEDSGG